MFKYILRRLIWFIPVIFAVIVLIFTLMYFTPGDPARIILGSTASDSDIEFLREDMGLNDPFLIRLFDYLKNIVLHFDFGDSYLTGKPVTQELIVRFPRTLMLALSCMMVSLMIGVPLGVNAAVNQNKLGDNLSMMVALVGISAPGFWVALLLVLLFALKLRWLPPSGIGSWKNYVLPIIAGSVAGIAAQARQSRSSMLEVIRSDYITTARAKGQIERKVIYFHALRNALIPVITVAGGSFAASLAGTLVLETIFAIPGMGIYLMNAVNQRDYPVIQGGVIVTAISFGMIMLIVDLIFAFIDPRIKAQYKK